MSLFCIIFIVFVLYIRTIHYNYSIDDHVKREGYPITPRKGIHPNFYDGKPSVWYRFFMIGMHCVNVSVIYLLWGWAPALLYAVHPMSIYGTAWVTGNYYATTAYFCLIAYFIFHTFPNIWGLLAAIPIYIAALNSTLESLTLPFIYLLSGNVLGLAFFAPLIIFLKGKKFKAALDDRLDVIAGRPIDDTKIPLNRFAVIIKILAKYAYTFFVPTKVYFFGQYGEENRQYQEVYNNLHSFNKEFWAALALNITLFAVGMFINPLATFWWFCFIGVHCQFNLIGQFYAQRYLYLPMIGLCILGGTLFQSNPWIIYFIAGLLAYKTHTALPMFKNFKNLLENEIEMNPERGDSYTSIGQYYMAMQPMFQYPRWMGNKISYYIRRAVDLSPTSWKCRMNLAAYLVHIGYIEEALVETKTTIELLSKVHSTREKAILEGEINQKIKLENQLLDIEKQRRKERLNALKG